MSLCAVIARSRESAISETLTFQACAPSLRLFHHARQLANSSNCIGTVLEYFLRHPEVLVTRAALADSVWGRGTADASNVVEVYISYLRRKLKPAGRRLLHTVRGGGYMLRDDGQP